MFRSDAIKDEPEDGEISFLEQARLLMKPSASSTRQKDPSNKSTQNSSGPSQAGAGNASHSGDLNRRASHYEGQDSSVTKANTDSLFQSDRAALLRAQLIDARKGATPSPGVQKEGIVKTSASIPGDRAVLQVPVSGDRNLSADIDALIHTEKSAQNGDHVSSGNANTYGQVRSDEKDKRAAPTYANEVRAGNESPKNSRRDSNNQGMVPKTSSARPLDSLTGVRDASDQRLERREIDSHNKYEQAEKERGARTKAADQYKEKHGIVSSVSRPGSGGDKKKDTNDGNKAKKPVDNSPSDKLDVSALPLDIQQWLVLTNWFNEEYRKKALGNYKKKLELQKQLRELDQSDLELRTSLGSGKPVVPAAVEAAIMSPPATAPSEKVEPQSGALVKWTPNSAKRSRDEEKLHESEPRKVTKTDHHPAEKRSLNRAHSETNGNTHVKPEKERLHRLTPPPLSREQTHSGRYESYRPGLSLDRDRHDPYRSRIDDRRPDEPRPATSRGEYGREREVADRSRGWASSSQLDRERESDERPKGWGASPEPVRGREMVERSKGWGASPEPSRGPAPKAPASKPPAEDRREAESPKRRRPYQGFPIIACRYYKQGFCHRGERCTFLHE